MASNFRSTRGVRTTEILTAAAALAWLACSGATSCGQGQSAAPPGPPALLDNMEGSTPVLRLMAPRPGVRLAGQSLDRNRRRSGSASEHVVVAAAPGESAQLAYAVPPAPVLDELQFTSWIWCTRPGVQLAALVVLPRSVNAETGLPRQLLVRSGSPGGGGDWQQLSLSKLPAQLAANVRVARAQDASNLDDRGAYVSHLVFLVPGGPGPTEIWVDQVAMHGAIRSAAVGEGAVAGKAPPDRPLPTPAAVPSMPRIIQWQGEPFAFLQRMGFDALAMSRTPTAEELAEARRLGLYLICPPPVGQLEAGDIGDDLQPVLAWDLGGLDDEATAAEAEAKSQAIRRHDPVSARAMVLRPQAMPLVASRITDLLLLDRPTLGATASYADYAAWLTYQRRLARPGTHAWIAVDTHWSSRFMAQLAAMRGGSPGVVPASLDELSLATTAAFGTLPRGFWFKSASSLAAADPETRRRTLALELTNLRLGLVEPWLAAGRKATTARSSRSDLTALVLTVERSHLLIPAEWSRGPDADRANAQPASFVLPGVPESSDAYLLTVAGPRRLETRRVTGGLRLTIEDLPDDGFILLTEDGYAFSHVDRYLRKYAGQAAQARVELAALNRQRAARAVAELPAAVIQQAGIPQELARVDAQLAAVHQTLANRDFAAAFARAAEADRMLDEIAQRTGHAIWPDHEPAGGPIPTDWSSLVDLARIAAAMKSAVADARPAPAGEFENLEELLAAGWRRQENPSPGVACAVRLSPTAPAAGAYSLELEAKSTIEGATPPAVPGPPVWITSPPLEAPPGHVVEISGWARVDDIPMGSADPLVIFDSIGGEESAVRLASAPSWTPFRMIRAVPEGAECRLTIALGGVGRAHLDSLRVRCIPLTPTLAEPESAARQFLAPALRTR